MSHDPLNCSSGLADVPEARGVFLGVLVIAGFVGSPRKVST